MVDLGAYEFTGTVPPVVVISADLDGDGTVSASDLAILLAAN